MIVSSQMSFLQGNSRQETAFNQSQLRINQQPLSGAWAGDQSGGSQLNITRDAAYRYSSQQRPGYAGSSTVSGGDRNAVFTCAELAEKTTELFLRGQQAVSVGRAALEVDDGRELLGPQSGSGFSERTARMRKSRLRVGTWSLLIFDSGISQRLFISFQ